MKTKIMPVGDSLFSYMKSSICLAAAALAACACAVDLNGLVDVKFAEDYAFSTNRAALVETLRPGTTAWFVYSILNAQTDGRLADADAILEKWRALENSGSGEWDGVSGEWDGVRYHAMRDRQDFLCYDREAAEGKDSVWRVVRAAHGIRGHIPSRETELKPNTYPSELGEEKASFEAFREFAVKSGHKIYDDLEDRFRFLAFTDDPKCENGHLNERAARDSLLPDTPGMFDHLLAYLKAEKGVDAESRRRTAEGRFASLTLAQLDALAKALKDNPRWSLTGEIVYRDGTKYFHSSSRAFIDAVIAKLAPGADADAADFAVREAVLKRRIAFAKSLGDGVRRDRLLAAQRDLLALYGEYGMEDGHIDLFWDYLETYGWGHAMKGDDLVATYVCACRKAARPRKGRHPNDFIGFVDCRFVDRTVAEFDLVSGKPPAEVGVGALTEEEFKKIQERVELNWAKSDPRLFASSADVSLAIDVKNVPKMRVAVYELDAAAACRAAKGEVAADIDLDCAVPTAERTIGYSAAPVLRHRETLDFPELKEPGLYVVECSGQGVASRVLVRKGRLRATARRDAAGHVFTALDEDGKVVKGAKLWLGGTVFKAEENGEIPVPFATSAKDAGVKTAVVEAGRLASTVTFTHETEWHSLSMSVVLPPEALVAGREATALVRPVLQTSGIHSALGILENPVLTLTFTDIRGRSSVRKFPGFELFDDAESVCRFMVPAKLARIDFALEGTVKRATGGDDERVSARWSRAANAIARTQRVEQLFLRRTSGGYLLECRGRTGEPVAHRAVDVRLKHRAFKGEMPVMMQGDGNGVVKLGPLVDIEEISTGDFGAYRWKLDCGAKWPFGGKGISAAEGEAIALPVRGLFDGSWPGAERMESRVSLLAVNRDGKYTADCIDACSYSNGVLRIAGLLAGDYRLTFRTEAVPTVNISVVRPGKGVGEGGVLAGAARAVTDTGSPDALRIDSAEVARGGTLRVKVANARADARVHVFAARTMRDSREGTSPFATLAQAREAAPMRVWKWGDPRSSYVSGRDLGDKLRYILDRRQEPGRIGNMLQLPSLVLSPWTTTETDTKEVNLGDGDGWAEAEPPESAAMDRIQRCGGGCGDLAGRMAPYVCRDFLPDPMAVFPNLRPGKDGVVEVDLSKVAGMQEVEVVVTDGRAMDEVALVAPAAPFAPRDLRVRKGFDALASSGRRKGYATIGDLYGLFDSMDVGGGGAFAEFRFLADWNRKDDAAKRELYGKYASHELDLFIYEKDRAFFDAVVAPNLKNKRRREFMDKWLLGEDVSGYAKPGRLQDLNALEQCLLARRVKSFAPVVARNLADWCEANPVDPDEDDRRMAIALNEMESEGEESCESLGPAPQAALEISPEEAAASYELASRRRDAAGAKAKVGSFNDTGWSSQATVVQSPVFMRSIAGSRSPAAIMGSRAVGNSSAEQKRREVARRQNRQLWRPPERTKEWVESNWYRHRHAADTLPLAPPSRFWRDYAAAVAAGKEGDFRTVNVMDASTFADKVAALALTRLGFEAKDGEEILFARGGVEGGGEETVRVERHFFDAEKGEDGGQRQLDAAEEFVRGKAYVVETIVMNPSHKRRVRVVSQLPEGAFPLGGGLAAEDRTVEIDSYDIAHLPDQAFYFPLAEEGVGRAAPVVAVERGVRAGASAEFVCRVVAESSKRDTTSWSYVSQKASKGEVLEYLRTKNLAHVDLARAGWRFVDGDFAKKALAVLEARGVFCGELWLAGLEWRDAYDERRVREALSRREARRRLAPSLGPVFKSKLVEIEPERDDVFEHREYWPIVNARAHAKGGAATIANKGLADAWRQFIDTLAAKGELSADDRLLAAVYLVAQSRIAEAEAQVAAAERGASSVVTRMQLDYLKAYLAFSRGDAAAGRALAEKWADAAATLLWRGRFREVVAQAKEIAGEGRGGDAAASDVAAAPSLAVKAEAKDGVPEGVVVTARNLAACTLKAYPVDVEIGFSKNPFGADDAVSGGMLGLKPAWTEDVALAEGKETRVALPATLRKTNLVLVATGAEGRVEERLWLMPGALDVQAAKEYGHVRVRDAKGRPVAGAYVKVYAKDASGAQTKFHKDGYTDMRGAFDYAGVSTDTEFRPAEFALFVQSADGVKTLRVPAPSR